MKKKICLLSICILAIFGVAKLATATEVLDINLLGGRYLVNESEDYFDDLIIFKYADNKAYFEVNLNSESSSCSLSGIADVQDNALVYDGLIRIEGGEAPCNFRLNLSKDTIHLEDKNSQCRENSCGSRSSYNGAKFDLKSRKDIKDAKKITESRSYKEAIIQYKKLHE